MENTNTITMMIGASGSGKSRHCNKAAKEMNAFIIDPDAIKLQLNKQMPLDKETNENLHPAASQFAAQLLESYFNDAEGFKDRYNCNSVILDNRGKDLKKVQGRIINAIQAGLKVQFIIVENDIVNCVLNVAIRNRKSKRSMKIMEVIRAYKGTHATIEYLKSHESIDTKIVEGYKRIKFHKLCNLLTRCVV